MASYGLSLLLLKPSLMAGTCLIERSTNKTNTSSFTDVGALLPPTDPVSIKLIYFTGLSSRRAQGMSWSKDITTT